LPSLPDPFSTKLVLAFMLLGYLVGLPVLLLTLSDGRTISRRVWAACGRRRSRFEQQLYIAYACAGWPVIVMAASWRTGRLRHELRRERAVERDRGRY
jgi:hypothetical protein